MTITCLIPLPCIDMSLSFSLSYLISYLAAVLLCYIFWTDVTLKSCVFAKLVSKTRNGFYDVDIFSSIIVCCAHILPWKNLLVAIISLACWILLGKLFLIFSYFETDITQTADLDLLSIKQVNYVKSEFSWSALKCTPHMW